MYTKCTVIRLVHISIVYPINIYVYQLCNPTDHRSSHPVVGVVDVVRSLCFIVFVFFSSRHCIVCPSTYDFLLPLWYHKILFDGKCGVELHQFHVFQTFYIDCKGQCKGLPSQIFIHSMNLEYFISFNLV